VFPVNTQRSLVYIGIVEAQGDKRVNHSLDEIFVDHLSVSLTFDQSENSTNEIALHVGEEIGFPQNESKLNTPNIGISDTTEAKSRLQYTPDILPSDLHLARAFTSGTTSRWQ